MDLLKYEFMKADETSFNGMLGKLVREVRHYRNHTSIDKFKAAVPQLQLQERVLNNIHAEMGEPWRNFIEEIMEELDQESAMESQLLDEIERSSKAIVSALYDNDFSMDDFAYEFRTSEAVYWVEFYGYKEQKQIDGTLLVVKEVFRSVCYKSGIIFIDSSLTERQ